MERDSYLDGIRSAWLGELFGEAFFQAMAERTRDEAMRSKWLTLAQLEQVTGRKMAEVLTSYGESTVPTDPVRIEDDVLNRYLNVSHGEAMHTMKDVVEKAVVHFDQLLAVAPEVDVPAVQFLVNHELALLTFVEREIEGKGESSLAEADRLISQAG